MSASIHIYPLTYRPLSHGPGRLPSQGLNPLSGCTLETHGFRAGLSSSSSGRGSPHPDESQARLLFRSRLIGRSQLVVNQLPDISANHGFVTRDSERQKGGRTRDAGHVLALEEV